MPVTFSDLPPNVVSTDLVNHMEENGFSTVESAASKGRAHWVDHFARERGFTRDFDELLSSNDLSWEEARSAEAFEVNLWEVEIGQETSMVLQEEGIESFNEVFERERDFWMEKIADSDPRFQELGDAIEAAGFNW